MKVKPSAIGMLNNDKVKNNEALIAWIEDAAEQLDILNKKVKDLEAQLFLKASQSNEQLNKNILRALKDVLKHGSYSTQEGASAFLAGYAIVEKTEKIKK